MLQKLPAEDLAEVRRVMYGVAEDHTPLEVPEEARALGEANNFEIQVQDTSAACTRYICCLCRPPPPDGWTDKRGDDSE